MHGHPDIHGRPNPEPRDRATANFFCVPCLASRLAPRATIALEHHRDAVPYTWVEALGWEKKPATGQENHAASDRTDWWYV